MQVTRFIYADKAKGVKCLLFSPHYIEHKISIFNELFNQMKKQKNLSYSLRKVVHPFKSSLNTVFSSIFSLLGVFAKVLKNVRVFADFCFGYCLFADFCLTLSPRCPPKSDASPFFVPRKMVFCPPWWHSVVTR